MSVSKICEPFCACVPDCCRVPKLCLHATAAIIWFCGVVAVNAKLAIYMMTVSRGISDEYDLLCLPDDRGSNRTYIPFAIGACIGLAQLPWIFKFVRRNHSRIARLEPHGGYLISQQRSCYPCYFVSFLITIIMSFVIADELLCGKDNFAENVSGSKCVFIGLDACVGLFLLFGFSGFIVSWIKGPLPDATEEYAKLINEPDSSNESNGDDVVLTSDNEQRAII